MIVSYTLCLQDNCLEDSLHANTADLQASSESSSKAIMRGVFSEALMDELTLRLSNQPFEDMFVAVRSSGTDEDSAAHSFAGQILLL